MIGREQCMKHGGKTKKGMDHPRFTTGRTSKYMPENMLPAYQEALNDPELLSLRSEVALCDARLATILGRVDPGGGPALWRELDAAYKAYTKAIQRQDVSGASEALAEVGAAVKKGNLDYTIWSEIRTTIEQRRKLAETEHKRLVTMQQMVTVERVMLMLGMMSGIVKTAVNRHVLDTTQSKAVLGEVAHEMTLMIGNDGKGLA